MTIVPNIAKGWGLSKDHKILTVYLREGMKWSDGMPFTADDILFWYTDILLNDELTPTKPTELSPGGELVRVEKIDDYTVHFRFTSPYPIIIELFSDFSPVPFAPKHYLKKYHIKYNPKANEIAKEEGYDSWWSCFLFHETSSDAQGDPNLPKLDPWVLKKMDALGNQYRERNPYYFKIDTAGNQLPYVDQQVKSLVESLEVLEMKLISGEFSCGGVYTKAENLPLYQENAKKGGYRLIMGVEPRGRFGVCFNQTHKDPVLRKIFRDVRFKQAMSLAIDRQEINESCFLGQSIPFQAAPMPTCSFYEDWMGKYYAEYDPEKANMLLDEMGLKWDKNHQYRLRPDGKPLAITLENGAAEYESVLMKVSELIKDYWGKVGVKLSVKSVMATLYFTRAEANELDIGNWALGQYTDFAMHRNPFRFRPPWSGNGSGQPWYQWYRTNGKTGEEPPEEIKRLFKLCEHLQTTVYGTKEYKKTAKEIATINLKGLFTIGTVAMSPSPLIVDDDLQNILKGGEPRPPLLHDYGQWGFFQLDQWFFEK